MGVQKCLNFLNMGVLRSGLEQKSDNEFAQMVWKGGDSKPTMQSVDGEVGNLETWEAKCSATSVNGFGLGKYIMRLPMVNFGSDWEPGNKIPPRSCMLTELFIWTAELDHGIWFGFGKTIKNFSNRLPHGQKSHDGGGHGGEVGHWEISK